jgi:hypothetical protein
MKFLRLLLFVLTAGILFTSCQKELSAETGSALGTIAKDAGGNCTPATPSGAYKKDTALNATNFVDIQLDITNVGIYIVTTDTVNGYYFRATGVTPLPGANTIRLVGFGKPIVAGTNLFKVKFNSDVCEFAVPVTGTTGGGTNAVFTYANTGAACTNAMQTGSFFVGVPTNPATHYITIYANVTTAGAYTLATNPAPNGLTFSASGSFATIGNNQPIVLRSIGNVAPTASGTTSYTFTTATPASSCGFDLTVQAAPTPATFTFNCGAPVFTGTYEEGTNTIGGTLKIQVTSVAGGSITLTSDIQNGVTFSGSVVLTASPTPQDVILNASGTPAIAGTFAYTITGVGGTGTCSVTQTYTAAPAATGFIKANINGGPLTTFSSSPSVVSIPLGGGESLIITADNGPTESFNCSLLSTSAIIQGTAYNVNQLLSGNIINANYTTAASVDYFATSDPTPQLVNPFTIKFISITATRATGTFSGNLLDNNGAGPGIKTFTNGTFDLPF